MSVHACTIIARNYLPAARVLATSFLRQHPGGRFVTLVVDDVYGLVDPASEPFEVVRLEDLPIDGGDRREMVAIYDVMELSTAVKPWLLELVLDRVRPEGAVVYLDPDIKVFSPLDEVDELAREHGIVLTPHATAPMPRDGKNTDETAILASGVYNLGFVALSAGMDLLLDFWKQRLRRECFVDPKRMRFVDQRWVDFVPGIFGAHILREPAYNVAYWNLDHRELEGEAGSYTIDGRPLRFFHFSGYSPAAPHLLSKHQGERPRILLSERPALRRICDEYGSDLVAHGYDEAQRYRYAFGETAEGLPLDQFMRRLYREALVAHEEHGYERPPNPLDARDGGRFVAWLNGAAGGPARTESGSKMSRYLAAVYERRVDLQAVFPESLADARRMYEWARHEASVGRLDPRLAPEDPPPLGLGAGPTGELRPGVRVAGYLRAETGVGEHARLVVEAVRRAGVEVSVHVDTDTLARQQHPFFGPERSDLNVNLVCINADELPRFVARAGAGFFRGRYNIGLWAWELEEFPERFAAAFAHLDEVWANSTFTQRAIARVSDKPVLAFPLPIVEPKPAPGAGRADFAIPEDRFCFLFSFDLLSIPARKNALGLLEAFCDAFRPDEGPLLVLKLVGSEQRPGDAERLKYLASGRPDVLVIDRYLDHELRAALVASCDCYVSLHRSEGFGLTMAEAMALGKPVIATGYSGNLDFMDEDTAYLVPWSPAAVPPASDPYPAGATWAEPDRVRAAELMRHVVAHPDEAAALGERARQRVLSEHGLDARARFVAERFQHAQEVLTEREAAAAGRAVVMAPAPAHEDPPLVVLARRRPDPDGPTSYPQLVPIARRLVLRALRHRDERQHELDLALAMGVEHVAHVVNLLQGELGALRGATDHLRNDLRLLAERVAKDEGAALVEATRGRQVLGQLAQRLAGLDHFGGEVREALERIEKDVAAHSSELDQLGPSRWEKDDPPPSPGSRVDQASPGGPRKDANGARTRGTRNAETRPR